MKNTDEAPWFQEGQLWDLRLIHCRSIAQAVAGILRAIAVLRMCCQGLSQQEYLMHRRTAAKDVAQFIMASEKRAADAVLFRPSIGRHRPLPRWSCSSLLLSSNSSTLQAEPGPDRSEIDVMAVCRDRCRVTRPRLGRSKECFGGCQVAVLAQQDADQGAIVIAMYQ